MFDHATLVHAQATSKNNEFALIRGGVCGCFGCCRIFAATEVTHYVEERVITGPRTGICPHCGVDALIADGLDFPLTTAFLRAMQLHWFDAPANPGSPLTRRERISMVFAGLLIRLRATFTRRRSALTAGFLLMSFSITGCGSICKVQKKRLGYTPNGCVEYFK